MTDLQPIHIAVMQPPGYVHSLGLIDPARYLRWQLRRLGATVTIGKNRLREDALNLVLGAHLGFPPEWRQRHACLFLNLEQTGEGGAALPPEYLKLLRGSAVVDYDSANVAAYADDPQDVPIIPFGHAPYLQDAPGTETALALEDRPIDLLFFGSVNPRRQALFKRLEAAGVNVTLFDHPLYGAERDAYIRQAKAVLNCSHYDSGRFEQVRVAHALSLGTPVVAERSDRARPGAAFEQAVDWVRDAEWESFFQNVYGTPRWFADARAKLAHFALCDPIEPYAELLAFAGGYQQVHRTMAPAHAWRPTLLNLGSGKDYRPGWLNVDVVARTEPDLLLDLGRPVALPLHTRSIGGTPLVIEPGQFERIRADNVFEHVPDLPMLLTQLLGLLKLGGELEVEVPYERAPTAWQDPTHLRALNENSWLYVTDWFWYLGWFEHRFEIAQSAWLDTALRPCDQAGAAFMQVLLRKVETTPRERTVARTMQPDFGGLPDDRVDVRVDAVCDPATVPLACEQLPA